MTAKRLTLLLVAVAAISNPSLTALAQSGPQVIDLSATIPSGLPDGFVEPAPARVRRANGWRSMIQLPGGYSRKLARMRPITGFPSRFEGVSAVNMDVSVHFKAVAGKVDRAGGIAVRLTDPDNYYVLRANALEDNVNLYRVVKGARSKIQGVSAKVRSGEWHTLQLRAEGDRFTVSYNGELLFTATDHTFAGAGKVALWTKADSQTRFADLRITTLP